MSLSSLWLWQSLSLLSSPPVWCLDNTMQRAPAYGICMIPAGMRFTLAYTIIALTIAITGHPGLPFLPWFIALHLQLWEHGSYLRIVFLLQRHFSRFHLHNNLLRVVGQGVNLVVHLLGENHPIIILQYTHHLLIGALTLSQCSTTSTWAIGIGATIDVIHRTLNLRWVLLYIFAIAQSHYWNLILQAQIFSFTWDL